MGVDVGGANRRLGTCPRSPASCSSARSGERLVGRWIRWTTTGCVALLALIAGTVSYLHMHTLVEQHGQPGWVAALTPFSVDGMIVAASTMLLADWRSGGRGGFCRGCCW
jgi:hypothetical protein